MGVYKVNQETGELERIAGGTLYADAPVGAIIPYGGSTAPSGWLLCQGQSVSRTTYAALFAAIGTAFGPGDGSTTFNLPDLREATTKGVGLSSKSSNHYDSDGVALGEFVEDRVQEHTHALPNDVNAQNGTIVSAFGGNGGSPFKNTGTNSGRSGATTEVKAVGVNYIIKAVQVALPLDITAGVEDMFEYKSGSVTLPTGIVATSVTFEKGMSDNDYVVELSGLGTSVPANVAGKTTTGFQIHANNSSSDVVTCNWKAFRIPH